MTRKLSDAQADDLVKRYVSGESTKQLGPAFGISSRVVSDYLRRAGIEARPRHHGIQRALSEMDPDVLSAKRSDVMRKRWESSTPEQRESMTAAAHAASRGKPRSHETKRRIVRAKEWRSGSDSPYEEQLAQWLDERGVSFTQQAGVGEHCADFSIGPVVVEVTTGWARKKEWKDTFACYFDAGRHLYVVWHDTRDVMLSSVADDLVAWVQILQSDPPSRSQHRVVWRSRQVLSTGGGDADYVAGVLRSSTPRGRWALYDRARDEA